MSLMAREATQPFMHAHRSPVVARSRLHSPMLNRRRRSRFRLPRSMALIANSLPPIRTHLHRRRSVINRRNRQFRRSKMHPLAPVKERQRIPHILARHRNPLRRPRFDRAFPMHPVARQTRHRRLIRKPGSHHPPRPRPIHRLDQIPHRAVEMHPMAPQTVVHQLLLPVLPSVSKNLPVRRAVRTRMPRRIFLLMALLASRRHRHHIGIPQPDRLRPPVRQMNRNVPQLSRQPRIVAVQAPHIPMRRPMRVAHRVRHFMTIRTPSAVSRSVVARSSINTNNSNHHRRTNQHRNEPEHPHHDRNLVPFQPRTSASDAKYAIAIMVSTGLNPPLVT